MKTNGLAVALFILVAGIGWYIVGQGQNFGPGNLPGGLAWIVPTFTISSASNGNAVLALSGNTSGTATFTAPAVAGTAANPVVESNALTIGGLLTSTNGCQASSCDFVVGAPGITPGQSVLTGAAYGGTVLYTHWMRFYNRLNQKLGTTCLIGVQTVSAGNHVHVGVYSVSGTTASLIWDCGAQLTTTAGQVANTSVAAVMMAAGQNYYIASCTDIITAFVPYVLDATAASASGAASFSGGGSMPAGSFGVDGTDVCTASAAALPATATTSNISFSPATTIVQIPYVVSVNP